MISDEGRAVLDILSEDERKLMRELARIAKTKTNVFSEASLRLRKACKEMNVGSLLQSLANKGLVGPVKGHQWRTTSLGRVVEHYLEYLDFLRLGYPVIRR